jgi:TfoX/Sxy family transcriptional regulator of competence genes
VPFDERLADRVRALVGGNQAVSERRMFGGVTWMLRGNMFAGVVKDDLMVRVGPAAYEAALAERDTRPMQTAGRVQRGYVLVAGAALAGEEALRNWVGRAERFAASLPPKKPRTR